MAQSGKYRHEVELLRRITTVAPDGQHLFRYVPFATVWARIAPQWSRENVAAASVQGALSVRVDIRWRSDVDETCRVRRYVDRSRTPPVVEEYDITGPPLADSRSGRRELSLLCLKRSAEGWRG